MENDKVDVIWMTDVSFLGAFKVYQIARIENIEDIVTAVAILPFLDIKYNPSVEQQINTQKKVVKAHNIDDKIIIG